MSDTTINLKLFDAISKDIRKSNEIATGKSIPNDKITSIHAEILKRDKDIKLKTVNRDYLAWQRNNWPAKVEFQIVTRIRQKIYFVQSNSLQLYLTP